MRRQPARRVGRLRVASVLGIGIFWICSLYAAAPQGGTEAQELRVALDVLRRENADLRRAEGVKAREVAVLSNQLARVETALRGGLAGLAADDADARSATDWRMLLVQSLRTLLESEGELTRIEDRARRLMLVSEQALKSAQKVDPARRAALEGELRAGRKWAEERERTRPAIMEGETRLPPSAKVLAVRLDLGVVALDAGRAEGVRVGMPWAVNRGKEIAARLVIVETREHASMAVIERMEADRPIREGEMAVLSKL